MTLYHGAHTRFALHVGQCWTPCERAAQAYADGSGIVVEAELDLDGLDVWECEGYDRDADNAPGDSLASLEEWDLPTAGSIDVIIFDDEDMYGRPHKTYRLMSELAVARLTVAQSDEVAA